MKPRQRRQQQVQRELRVSSNHQRAGWSLCGAAQSLIKSHQFGNQWTTRLQISLPTGGECQAANAAFEQTNAKAMLQCRDELLDRRHAPLEAARSARKAALLGASDEVAQGAKLVHRVFRWTALFVNDWLTQSVRTGIFRSGRATPRVAPSVNALRGSSDEEAALVLRAVRC